MSTVSKSPSPQRPSVGLIETLFPSAEVRERLNKVFDQHLRHALVGVALLNVFFLVSGLRWLSLEANAAMSVVNTVSLVFCVTIRILLQFKKIPNERATLVGALFMLSLLLNGLVYIHVQESPYSTESIVFALGVAGFVLLSTPLFVGSVVGILACWAIFLRLDYGITDFSTIGIPVWGLTFLVSIVFFVRMRIQGDIVRMRLDDTKHRLELEEALERAHHELEERRRTEVALQAAKDTYRAVTNLTSDILMTTDLQGNMSYLNEGARRFFGLAPGEGIGDPASAYIHPEDLASAANEFAYLMEHGTNIVGLRLRMKTPSGWRIVEWNGSPILDENGELAGEQAIGRDVTERQKSEQAVRESEEKWRSLVTAAPDFILVVDREFCITYINRISPDYAGPELYGISIPEIVPPEAKDLVVGNLNRALESGEQTDFEIMMPGDDLESWFSVRISAIRDGDEVQNLMIVARDISEQKAADQFLRESEQKFRLLAEYATDFIWTANMNFGLTYISPSGLRMLGYEPNESHLLRMDTIITPECLKKSSEAFLDELMRERDPNSDPHRTRTLEVESVRKDGSTFPTEEKVTFLRDRNLKPIGIIGINRDVSERKTAEEDKSNLEEQLRQSQKLEAIGTLAGGIAHDFNNLLTGILGYSNLLEERAGNEAEVRKAARVIEKAADRGKELTRQLLGFARKGKHQNTPVKIDKTVREVVKLLNHTINKEVEIAELLRSENACVLGDPSQMQQVILNLAVNANDAMPDGGRLILETEVVELDQFFCTLHPGLAPGPYVQLVVSDTGTGIEPEAKERLFEPFFTTKEQGKGTGMGLAMVYGIVKNHGGTIQVYSEEGQGATFKIFLPLVERSGEAEASKPAGARPVPGHGRILIVDDEEIIRQMAKDMLGYLGYEVESSPDGEAAVLYYKEHYKEVDLVILDMVMPKMGGKECFRALKEINPDVRAVLSTGFSRDGAAQEILDEGLVDFIQKPYRVGNLSEVIAAALA